MSQVLVTEDYLEDIADAIRDKTGSEDTYTPAQMAGAIEDIHTADEVVLVSKSVTANGSYNPASDSADGYSDVTVDVPNSYAASDEGKVVVNQALTDQTSKSINANGTYDTTANNSVVVDVPNSYAAADEGKVVSNGALVSQTSETKTENGTYDTTLNNEIVVNVQSGGGIPGVSSGTNAPNDLSGNDGDFYIRSYSIPSGINFVEYLEGDGTAYIDTGIKANQKSGFFVRFMVNGTNSPGCGRRTATDQTFGVTVPSAGTVSLDYYQERRQKSGFSNGDIVDCFLNRRISLVDGENIKALASSNDFTTPANVILFGINATNSYGLVAAQIKIYRATFYESGVITKDFIPALDGNGIPCMYEIISGTYYYNSAGSGSFSYGNTDTPFMHRIVYKKISGSWHIFNQTSEP